MNPRELMTMTEMTDEQFRQHVAEILCRELGIDGYARFLRIYCTGNGDYTRDRHKWLDGVTIEEILKESHSHV